MITKLLTILCIFSTFPRHFIDFLQPVKTLSVSQNKDGIIFNAWFLACKKISSSSNRQRFAIVAHDYRHCWAKKVASSATQRPGLPLAVKWADHATDLGHNINNEKKRSEATQTLGTGCSKAEPKIFAPPQTPFPGAKDSQNLIS